LRRSQANAAIAGAGGTVTWNAIDDPQGVWEIDLSRTNLDDSGLENLMPSLNRYSPLDLDLRATGVTDSGLAHLKGLKNLVRVRLGKTQVTDEGVSELRRALPDLRVDR